MPGWLGEPVCGHWGNSVLATPALYPDCGCPPERRVPSGDPNLGPITTVHNVVCRNGDCIDYGVHRRGLEGDCCNWCCVPYTLLREDPFRGAR